MPQGNHMQPDYEENISQFHTRLHAIKERHTYHDLGESTHSPIENYFVLPNEVREELMRQAYIPGILKELDNKDGDEPLIRSTLIISQKYATVLSILLEARLGRHIKELVTRREYVDARLPFTAPPPSFKEGDWSDFKAVQRHFLPWHFTGEHHSPQKDCVFPYTKQELHREDGSTAEIYDVTLHPAFDGLKSQRQEPWIEKNGRYAIKKFKGKHAKDFFKNERRIFKEIRKSYAQIYPQGIIECLDSYETEGGETQCLILEFASGGSLGDLFINHAPPKSCEDIKRFWTQMFEIFDGLARLHDITERGTGINCIHNDLHPANILLVEDDRCRQDPTYCLKYRYVIADLGHATTVKTTQESATAEHRVRRAGIEFAAPEAHPASANLANINEYVTSAVDIFSVGAILLVAAVWVTEGQDGVKNFMAYRQQENQKNGRTGTGFHTGQAGQSELLSAVNDYLLRDHLRRKIEQDDMVTKLVLDQLVRPMMNIIPSHRPTAKDICLNATRIKATRQRRPTSTPRPKSFMNGLAVPSIHNDKAKAESSKRRSMASARYDDNLEVEKDILTVEDVLSKRKRRFLDKLQRKILPKWHGIPQQHKLQELKDRDFIFLFDDSVSMGAKWRQAKRTFDAMSYIAQEGDDDGIEFYFASSGEKRHTRNMEKLVSEIEKRKYVGICPMAERLKDILDDCLLRLTDSSTTKMAKNISVYVLTDGQWKDKEAVKRVIIDITETLTKNNFGRRELSIVFVSFAKPDDEGAEIMQYLDDLEILGEAGLDIVDMESHKRDVCKMLLGGMCSDYDDIDQS